MKRFFSLLLPILSLTATHALCQSLETDKEDEFTKKHVKQTSYETLYMGKFTAYVRISKENESEWIDLKLMIKGVFSIDQDAEFMFKLDNDEIISIKNTQYVITCTGCGANGYLGSQAQGIKTSYVISPEQHAKLLEYKVIKVRIYTSDGYVEGDIKEKNALIFQNALRLVD